MVAKISIKNLQKSFGSKKVLSSIDIDIDKNESLVILGGSGSGKSVLIKTIIGLMNADNGSILIDGEETVGISQKRRNELMKKFGFLFQGGALFDSLPIWKNVAFAVLHDKNYTLKQAKDLAIEKLESVGLDANVAELFPAELSGGMQKRASLARAIALNPEIIFFDEPTTGLDPIMAGIIDELIIKNSKILGATTITITHDMQSARRIADKIAMIYEGAIIWHDNKNKLDNSGNEIVQQFITGSTEGPIKIKLQDH